MTPLAASLIFIIITIIVSIFRHFIFHTSINSGDDTNISLTKLHTLTIPQQIDGKLSFNSLYQAFYKPHESKDQTLSIPYNSYVLKKAILNNEDVYICDQKFAAIFDEKTQCEGTDNICKWRTIITVYRLPYLKKQEEKIMELQGRVLKSGGHSGDLICNKKQISQWQQHFELNFVILKKNKQSSKGSAWTMNSLLIEDHQKEAKKNSTFVLKMMKWNLKKVHHYPKLYSFDEKCLSYVTEEEPWLLNYNCGGNWSSFNILHPRVQSTLFSSLTNFTSQPPFSATHHVTPLYLQLFKSTVKSYSKAESCTGACPRQQTRHQKNFLTYVFQIVNGQYMVGSTVAEITISLSSKASNSDIDGLTSHALILNEINPQKRIKIDCKLDTKEIKLLKGLYAYQLGLQTEQYMVASIDRHSLLCICSYSYMQNLKIVFFEDLLNNFNSSSLPSKLLVRTNQDLEQSRIEFLIKKDSGGIQQPEEEEDDDEDENWLDIFDITDYYREEKDEPQQKQVSDSSEGTPGATFVSEGEVDDSQRRDKKGKLKGKKEEKKRAKKSRKERREDNELLQEEKIVKKIAELGNRFEALGQSDPVEVGVKMLHFPMPFTLTSDSKFKIINGDLQFPLIYIETAKKYILTYQPKDPEQEKIEKNQTKRALYSYKYSEIGTSVKSSENYIKPFTNDSNKIAKRKDEVQLDRFLIDIVQHNSDLLNKVKSIMVVDAKYEGKSQSYSELKGLKKPYRKEIIVAWGWGIEVYEVNWDKKGLKSQISEIESILSSNEDGIEMLTLLPFIQLFATVYCLFQTLVPHR